MANETQITVVGNLTADPELRYTQAGDAVANFTIASTPRKFNKQTNQFEEGEALFLRCSVWRGSAEHVASSLSKGMRVIAQGDLVQRSYETKEGEKRTSVELQVTEIGPSLRYATAQVTRQQLQGGVQGGANDGWATGGWQRVSRPSGGQQGAPVQGQQSWDEEPPF
ncbi:single-stranded DNA-binding protein [Microbacterium sp.]|uniref:single-stranded DNA-binding protein n=1 Tax=Microbacterium sp. TaxID=51671 RepID=UPI002FDF1F02